MAIIHVDGKQFEVDGGDNLLHACLSLGLDVPYFCWHPELGSVGACRQCAVMVPLSVYWLPMSLSATRDIQIPGVPPSSSWTAQLIWVM